MIETYCVEMECFPKAQAVAIKQIHEHVGTNMCIQLVHMSEDGSHKNIHNYFSVNDPDHVEVPAGLDQSKNNVVMCFSRPPASLCYPEFTTDGDLHFPHGASKITLRDCCIKGEVFLGSKMQLTVEWVKKSPQTMTITTC